MFFKRGFMLEILRSNAFFALGFSIFLGVGGRFGGADFGRVPEQWAAYRSLNHVIKKKWTLPFLYVGGVVTNFF